MMKTDFKKKKEKKKNTCRWHSVELASLLASRLSSWFPGRFGRRAPGISAAEKTLYNCRNYYDFNKIMSHLGACFCPASVVGAWGCRGKVCNQRKIPALLRVRIYHWLICVVFKK